MQQATAKKPQTDIIVKLFDGTRNPATISDVTLRVRDGGQKEVASSTRTTSTFQIPVDFHGNFKDTYAILVTATGYRDAGLFPVKAVEAATITVDLMLVKKTAGFKFLPLSEFQNKHPRTWKLLSCGDAQKAQRMYGELSITRPDVLACMLNIAAGMDSIHLPVGTPIDYLKEVDWDSAARDRFIAFVDIALLEQVKRAAEKGIFKPEPCPGLFHKDATCSYKQVQFGEANVQLTFHEKATKNIAGVNCVGIELDIDYHKDIGSHALLEVIPNTLSRGLTNPQVVYVLRWMAGRHAGVPEFDPGYVLA